MVLALGAFDLALRGLFGDKAALSASTVARLKEKWQAEWEGWRSRPLDDLEVVYLWVDGVYVKAALEKEKAVLLVVLSALSDGSKVVVSVTSGYRESTQSWSEVLRDLKQRGMGCPRLVIGDGHLGIWGALRNVYPQAEEQRCWNHRIALPCEPDRGFCQYFPLNPQLLIFFAQLPAARLVLPSSGRLYDGLHPGLPRRSSCGSSVRWVQTLGPAHRGCARLDEARLSAGETRVDKLVLFLASCPPFSQRIRCPRNRGNSSVEI